MFENDLFCLGVFANGGRPKGEKCFCLEGLRMFAIRLFALRYQLQFHEVYGCGYGRVDDIFTSRSNR